MRLKQRVTEVGAFERALKDHPEFQQAVQGGMLPHQIILEDGTAINPRLHLAIHAIVERQLAADDPSGVKAVARELEQLGVSRHEVRHCIGRAVAEQMAEISDRGRPFDEEQYMQTLRLIVAEFHQEV
jgi:hypothetical protein